MKNALILVDIQNDFCPYGSLAVSDGDQIVPIANALQPHFDRVVATQDWHPQDHVSFAANHPGYQVGDMITVSESPQVLWPSHCIQHSNGAAFHPDLQIDSIRKIFHKGIDRNIDSYSGFYDNAQVRSTGLAEYLQHEGISDVYIMGLATDYCVKYTCLDALALQFRVHLILDGCRGVELHAGDVDKAISEMQNAGAIIIESSHLLAKND